MPALILYACRVCGVESIYEICNNCVPPTVRSRRHIEEARQQGMSYPQYESYYEHLSGRRPPTKRLYDPEIPLDEED